MRDGAEHADQQHDALAEPIRRTARDWGDYLAAPNQLLTLEEFRAREASASAFYGRLMAEAVLGAEGHPNGLLRLVWQSLHVLERIWGSNERQEIYYHRQDPRYPLAQLDEPMYLDIRALMDKWEEQKRAIASGDLAVALGLPAPGAENGLPCWPEPPAEQAAIEEPRQNGRRP